VASLDTVVVSVPGVDAPLARIITDAGLAASNSEATRKIQQGGVKVDREKVADIKARYPAGREFVLEVGRRAVRVTIRSGS
jgi:tyrosyl-tRNA synthetase